MQKQKQLRKKLSKTNIGSVTFRNRDGKIYAKVRGSNFDDVARTIRQVYPKAYCTSARADEVTFRVNPGRR